MQIGSTFSTFSGVFGSLALTLVALSQLVVFVQPALAEGSPAAEPPREEAGPPPGGVAASVTTNAEAAADSESDASTDVASDAEDADDPGAVDEGEREALAPVDSGTADDVRYSADVADADLATRWVTDLPSLGSISVGLAEEGRVINAVQLQASAAVQVQVPEYAWATGETVDAVVRVATAMRAAFPEGAPLRISHIGKPNGGYIHGHFSHQSGRDVDFGFYYQPGVDPANLRGRRETLIDLARNWTLVRALATEADVQVILVDRRIRDLLYAQALAQGEDKAWLDALFRAPDALVRHARRHRDHFHVRFYSPRAQELGRRVQPILAKRPDENIAIYRVRSGDTLGHIAQRFGSGVTLIQKANGMRNTFLRLGRTLVVPLRGPCTRCPLPPPVVVPERRLPPACLAGDQLAANTAVAR